MIFIPRHGNKHSLPPHKIPYLANLWAMKELGVNKIIAPCAAGSLKAEVKPGDFVICDQFIDRTNSRTDTFFEGPNVTHISAADPYCSDMRQHAINTCKDLNISCHETGTMVVIQGPRFSTKAESRWFSSIGCSVINMTGYPECVLAREQEICYVNISLITDYDAGLTENPEIKPVTTEEVVKTFHENNQKIKKLVYAMIENMPEKSECRCNKALEGAQL